MINWTEESLALAVALDAEGYTVPEIGKRLREEHGLDFSCDKIRGKLWRLRNGTRGEKRQTQMDTIDLDQFRDLIERGYTTDLIARKLSVATTTVRKFARKHDIKLLGHLGRIAATKWTHEQRETVKEMAQERCRLQEICEAVPDKTRRQVQQMLTNFRLKGEVDDDGYVFEDTVSDADIEMARIMLNQGHSWEMIAIRLRRFTVEEIRAACEAKIKEFCR